MKKTITIITCDTCGKDILKGGESTYNIVFTDSPGFAHINYMGEAEETVLCEECFNKLVKPSIMNWEYHRDGDKEEDKRIREKNRMMRDKNKIIKKVFKGLRGNN